MAKAFLPFRLGKALNYHFKLFTDNFTRIPYVGPTIPHKVYRQYAADLIVQQHPDYPDIPSSIWTVEVNFDENGGVRSCVKPKEQPESLKQASVVLMDWKVRTGWVCPADIECEDCLDACKGRIGPDGWKLGSCSSMDDFSGEFELVRDKQDFVLVSLTFIVEKNAARSDLETLLNSALLSDCKLVCGTEQFPVHRAILAAQSPVFEALCQTDMKENVSGTVQINNIGPDALESLLKYAYTRDLASVDVELTEVWDAAHKYGMADLMKECERLMLGFITDDNALKYLNFAAEHGLRMLKIEAAKIISQESP